MFLVAFNTRKCQRKPGTRIENDIIPGVPWLNNGTFFAIMNSGILEET